MIRRTTTSKWFGDSIVDLPPNVHEDINCSIGERYKSALPAIAKKHNLKHTAKELIGNDWYNSESPYHRHLEELVKSRNKADKIPYCRSAWEGF
jgi:hypothetical protein